LNPQSEALLVPPGIWASQIYRREDSVLLVLCDMNYDPKDYVRNYQSFLESAKAKLI